MIAYITCVYCGQEGVLGAEIEMRNGKFACIDSAACDRREERAHRAHLRELRRRIRAGDELTEAERQEITDG